MTRAMMTATGCTSSPWTVAAQRPAISPDGTPASRIARRLWRMAWKRNVPDPQEGSSTRWSVSPSSAARVTRSASQSGV